MSKSAKRSSRVGSFLFFIPVIAILALMLFGVLSYVSSESGTLVITSVSSDQYTPSVQLHVAATVAGNTEATPFNLTLSQGDYTIIFGQKTWYVTPPAKTVAVPGGGTVYATGLYLPVLRGIGISQDGFNTTHVSALHGVTPVVWTNHESAPVTIRVDTVGFRTLQPSQNLVVIFSVPGSYSYSLPGTNSTGSVNSI